MDFKHLCAKDNRDWNINNLIMEKSKKHTCNYGEGKFWHTYEYLENRVIEASRYAAIDPLNRETWGEELASIFILTGNSIDTFFRNMIACPCVKKDRKYIDYKSKPKEKNNWNVTHFRKLFESIYELSANKIEIPFGLGEPQELKPFEKFQCSESPEWWIDFNSLKHDYYENLSKANQFNVINAIGALLILNALHMCSRSFLAEIGVIEKVSHGYVSETTPTSRKVFHDRLLWSKLGTTPWAGEATLVTPLFIFNYRMDSEAEIQPHDYDPLS